MTNPRKRVDKSARATSVFVEFFGQDVCLRSQVVALGEVSGIERCARLSDELSDLIDQALFVISKFAAGKSF